MPKVQVQCNDCRKMINFVRHGDHRFFEVRDDHHQHCPVLQPDRRAQKRARVELRSGRYDSALVVLSRSEQGHAHSPHYALGLGVNGATALPQGENGASP
jgi:hypothetical protein